MNQYISASGTDLSFYIVVINASGNHVDPDGWAANPNSAAPILQSHPSAIAAGVRNGSGDYTFSFSGLSPAISDGTIALIAVTGAINGVSWSPWYERVLVRNKATIGSDVRSAVGLASANLDTQLDNIPTVSEMNARTLPSGQYSVLTSGDIVSATQTTISNNYLQYLFAEGYNPASKPGVSSGVINSLMDSTTRRFSVTALELAPVGSGGGGSGDWTSTEKAQIRYVLGLDGSTSVPTATPSGLFRSNVVQINGVTASGTGGSLYADIRYVNGVLASGTGTVSVDAAEIRSAVGLATANLDTQLGDIPTVTEFNARTLPSGTYSTLTSGNVVGATQQTIENNYLQYLFASTYNPASKPGSSTSIINSLIDSSVRQFSATALELAPVGSGGAGGSGDWTSTEKAQIRYVLGLDGSTATPTVSPSGLFRSNLVRVDNVSINGTGEVPISAVSVRNAVGLASANLDTQLDNIPTVTEFNARTLPSGTYFDPATDTVATVTTLTNLPSITTNWLTAAGLAADAVAEIQSGLSILTSGNVQSIVSSGVNATQSTQASNAQTGAAAALTAYDPPTRAELTTDKNEIIASGLTQAGVRAAVGLASANLDTQLDNIPTITEFNARTLPSGTYSTLSVADISTVLSSGVTVNVISSGAFQDIFETYTLIEDYPTNGQAGTPAELLYLMKQAFTEFTITGSTITVKKLDGSTTAATYTMDSATAPTSRTRAT